MVDFSEVVNDTVKTARDLERMKQLQETVINVMTRASTAGNDERFRAIHHVYAVLREKIAEHEDIIVDAFIETE
jgi:hypothetical protein